MLHIHIFKMLQCRDHAATQNLSSFVSVKCCLTYAQTTQCILCIFTSLPPLFLAILCALLALTREKLSGSHKQREMQWLLLLTIYVAGARLTMYDQSNKVTKWKCFFLLLFLTHYFKQFFPNALDFCDFICTRRCGTLRRPSSSSCGGLRPLAGQKIAFYTFLG